MKNHKYLIIVLFILGCKPNEEKVALPLAPSNLIASVVSTTNVSLSWTDIATNEDGYKIQRKSNGENYLLIGTLGPDAVTFNDLTVVAYNTYTYRVFSYNSAGNSLQYSNEVTITVKSVPIITTNTVSSITSTSAICGGNISNEGGNPVTTRGICWGVNTNPTIALSNLTTNGSGTGVFSSSLSALIPNTKYYIKAYATNSIGTGYGNEVTFTTAGATLPTITTSTVTSITYRAAVSGGQITSNGNAPIVESGAVWSTKNNPTYESNSGAVGNGTGAPSFVSNLQNLEPGTKYFIRAYARNVVGISYGQENNFTTVALTVPTLTTIPANKITSKTAQSGGKITVEGGSLITVKGICWSTTTNPTIQLSTKTTDGSGLADFTSDVKGLSFNVKYYVRSYATNATGTGYGDEINFTTVYTIGEIGPAGGYIFYDKGVFSNGWRYLEAASNEHQGIVWWNGVWTYQNSAGISPKKGLGDGKENTMLIISANNNLYNAAKFCHDYSQNGFADWYLTSIGELDLMCQNLISAGLGYFTLGAYWSSTDDNRIYNAWWLQRLDCMSRTDGGRNTPNGARPIRQF